MTNLGRGWRLACALLASALVSTMAPAPRSALAADQPCAALKHLDAIEPTLLDLLLSSGLAEPLDLVGDVHPGGDPRNIFSWCIAEHAFSKIDQRWLEGVVLSGEDTLENRRRALIAALLEWRGERSDGEQYIDPSVFQQLSARLTGEIGAGNTPPTTRYAEREATPGVGSDSAGSSLPRGGTPPAATVPNGTSSAPATAGDDAAGSGDCLPADRITRSTDEDIRRNAAAILNGRFCYRVDQIVEGGQKWTFQTITAPQTGGRTPTFFVPHDNEQEAFDTGIQLLREFGGTLLAVSAGENRFFGQIDPNRYFGDDPSRTKACASLKGRAAPAYTARVMAVFDRQTPIITLHNNTDGGAISARVRTDKELGHMAPSPISPDPDDLVYITSTEALRRGSADDKRLRDLLDLGINVIFERVSLANNDCSLSNYAALIGRAGDYYNIEAEHGHAKEQLAISRRLLGYLGYRPLQ
ncbi:MAG: hypothetical protein GC150_13505 [Rhizobiales bacterium]|nr:hypothetical protein [Hyphomicrobiales bacterium]